MVQCYKGVDEEPENFGTSGNGSKHCDHYEYALATDPILTKAYLKWKN